ncbi:MAG: hypothetical protein ACI8X5_004278, partial [Planctomycetota bacterium]
TRRSSSIEVVLIFLLVILGGREYSPYPSGP